MSYASSSADGRHLISWTVPPRYVGWFFLWTSGVHVGIVAADPGIYRDFADNALLPGLTAAWQSTFMAHAAIGGLLVATAEATFGLLLLGPWFLRRLGWGGAIAFHLALMTFGWGFWFWSIPAIALLARGAVADRRSLMHLDRSIR